MYLLQYYSMYLLLKYVYIIVHIYPPEINTSKYQLLCTPMMQHHYHQHPLTSTQHTTVTTTIYVDHLLIPVLELCWMHNGDSGVVIAPIYHTSPSGWRGGSRRFGSPTRLRGKLNFIFYSPLLYILTIYRNKNKMPQLQNNLEW